MLRSLFIVRLRRGHILQHFPVERQVGDDLLEPAVLVFKRLQPAGNPPRFNGAQA
jgi:hypothetical protein